MNKYVHTHPQFPRKPYHKCIPVFRPKRRKNATGGGLPDGAAHTYMAYIREHPSPTPKAKRLSIKTGFSFNVIIKSILRIQATFRNLTTGFPAKWRLRNERRNSILMTRHYPDLGSASDWLNQISHAARPIKSTTQIWVVTRHQYGDFLLRSFLRCRYAGKPVVASQNVGSFLRLKYSRLRWNTQWTPKIQQ